jgi:Transposase IS66 family/IS66 C-terminal element
LVRDGTEPPPTARWTCRCDPLTRWTALCRFLDDGRIELDNNTVERVIRPIALGRKNHLFAGSDGGAARWAVVASLSATAKLNDVEHFAYLKDVLERLSDGHPMSRLDELLPWNWASSLAAAAEPPCQGWTLTNASTFFERLL